MREAHLVADLRGQVVQWIDLRVQRGEVRLVDDDVGLIEPGDVVGVEDGVARDAEGPPAVGDEQADGGDGVVRAAGADREARDGESGSDVEGVEAEEVGDGRGCAAGGERGIHGWGEALPEACGGAGVGVDGGGDGGLLADAFGEALEAEGLEAVAVVAVEVGEEDVVDVAGVDGPSSDLGGLAHGAMDEVRAIDEHVALGAANEEAGSVAARGEGVADAEDQDAHGLWHV